MSFTLSILCYVSLIFVNSNNCRWEVEGQNGNAILDLSCPAQKYNTVELKQSDESHNFFWSLCKDGMLCIFHYSDYIQTFHAYIDVSCGPTQGMVKQVAANDENKCFICGKTIDNIEPQYNEELISFEFTYNNGDNVDCENEVSRTWIPTFQCSESEDWTVGPVLEEEGQQCYYKVTITTKYACQDNIETCKESEPSKSLGLGYIFIMILFGLILLYCIIGYLINGICINREGGISDFKENVPNKDFWLNLPKLVMAGCIYSKDVSFGVCSGNKTDGDKDDGDEKEESLIDE